jgi:hypothetical protein
MHDLKDVFKEAAELAQQVPQNIQEAAFNRAVDLLTSKSAKRRRPLRTKASRGSGEPTPSSRETPVSTSTDSKSSKKTRNPSSGLAPKSAIVWLLETGFFTTGRTGPAVQDYLKTKRGYDLATDRLRMVMLRLVREGILEREENAEGQYEYKQPGLSST